MERIPLVSQMKKLISLAKDDLDLVRSRFDVADELFDEYQRVRQTEEYKSVYEKDNPLVSVCVATYNRSRLLQERCIASLLAQDYQNIEIIVVGDGCTDDTNLVMEQVSDARVKFVNIWREVDYPLDPIWRWMVAGTYALNHALTLARGDFITHLDDDDEHAPNRISSLVKFVRETRADIVWHPFHHELPSGRWRIKDGGEFMKGNLTTSSVFYHQWFRRILWDVNAYKFREPGDWNRFRKFKYLGVKGCFYPKPLLRHFRERNQEKGV